MNPKLRSVLVECALLVFVSPNIFCASASASASQRVIYPIREKSYNCFIAKAFLLIEDFYEHGRDGTDVPDPYGRTVEDLDYPYEGIEPPNDDEPPVDDKDLPF